MDSKNKNNLDIVDKELYTADELVEYVQNNGFPEFSKRNFYYYLYDKKLYGEVGNDNKSYSKSVLNKTFKILNLKQNTRYTLSEIKKIVNNENLYDLTQNNIQTSLNSYSGNIQNTFNTYSNNIHCNNDFCNELSTEKTVNCANDSFVCSSSICGDSIENYKPDCTAVDFCNNVVKQSNCVAEISDIVSKDNNVQLFGSVMSINKTDKAVFKINDHISIVYEPKATVEVLKIAELFIKEQEKNIPVEYTIEMNDYLSIIKFLKILSMYSIKEGLFYNETNDITFYKNDINVTYNKNSLYDIQLNDIIKIKSTNSTIKKFKKYWEE